MTLGWGVDSNAADMKRLHARNVRQLAVLQAKLDTTRGKLAGAEARAVRAEQALLGVRKTLDALCEPTRLTHPTRLRSALDAFLAAVPVVGAEKPTGQCEHGDIGPHWCSKLGKWLPTDQAEAQ